MVQCSADSSVRSLISKPWRNQLGEIARYWRLYGGWRSLILSPYAQTSVILGLLCIVNCAAGFDPAATIIAIIPAILGFTIGALAIILAFSSAEFFAHLTDEGNEKSIFMKTVANFVHFICVQVVALLISILCLAHPILPSRIAASIMLFYAILTAFSTVIQLFQLATIFNLSKQNREQADGQEDATTGHSG